MAIIAACTATTTVTATMMMMMMMIMSTQYYSHMSIISTSSADMQYQLQKRQTFKSFPTLSILSEVD